MLNPFRSFGVCFIAMYLWLEVLCQALAWWLLKVAYEKYIIYLKKYKGTPYLFIILFTIKYNNV